MEFIYWIIWHVKEVFPLEMALTLGVIFFGLSWIRPRSMVALPPSGRRGTLLAWLGTAGPLAVLAVVTAVNWLAVTDPLQQNWGGWWQRPASLLTSACVIAVAALVLRREPLPTPGERAISPRRHWWSFTPRTPLWLAATAASLLLLTTAWHSLIGVSAPATANRYGIGPGETDLPVYMRAFDGVGYIWGAGWPNHLATLLAVLLTAAVLAIALSGDANRPLFARATTTGVREERAVTARLLVYIALGGVLLTLGAVWAHVGFIGEFTVSIYDQGDGQQSTAPLYVGTGYSDFAFLMHKGGYVIQGIGAGLLLRLAVDTFRARGTSKRMRRADGPDPDTVLAGSTAAHKGDEVSIPSADGPVTESRR